MSIQIHNWAGLQQFGINPLTGEACKYSMRLLCDLNEDGLALLRDFLGLQTFISGIHDDANPQFPPNWNSQVNGKPALASIMLARGIYNDLCHFALFRAGVVWAVRTPAGDWMGYSEEDVVHYSLTREKLQVREDWTVHANPAPRDSGSRNQHAFTGRTT